MHTYTRAPVQIGRRFAKEESVDKHAFRISSFFVFFCLIDGFIDQRCEIFFEILRELKHCKLFSFHRSHQLNRLRRLIVTERWLSWHNFLYYARNGMTHKRGLRLVEDRSYNFGRSMRKRAQSFQEQLVARRNAAIDDSFCT